MYFFFSSRRRHTRYIGDWSSDVCSSDLGTLPVRHGVAGALRVGAGELEVSRPAELVDDVDALARNLSAELHAVAQIGRASCRERVLTVVVGGVLILRGLTGGEDRREICV